MYNYPYGDNQQINLNWIISEIIALHQRLDPDYTAPTFTQIYPFSDTQQLNLDWILTELKALKELAPPPSGLSSDDVLNDSTVSGSTVTDALNTLLAAFGNLDSDDIDNDSTVTGASVTDALNNLNGAINNNQIINAKWVLDLPDNTDLDTLFVNGWYTTGNTRTYINTPVPNDTYGQRIIVVFAYNNETATSYRHQFYANRTRGIYGHRVYASGQWTAWNTYGTNLLSESFTPSAITAQGNYKDGTTIRIGSYNVAEYDNDTSTKIPDVNILNFRKFLADSKLDFLLTQEETHYIDANETKAVSDWLYQPIFNEYYSSGVWGNIIHCHGASSALASGKLAYSDIKSSSRCLGYAVFQITNNIKLLLITTHCVWKNYNDDPYSAENIAGRLQNYKDIFEWANGTKTLPKYSDASAVTVPTHTHTIVCMDANSISDTDKSNLMAQAAANNFILGNGGRFGWFKTCIDRDGMYALDQIAVSNNIIINNIEPQMALYKQLYSDHVPVIAEVTLMPS